MQEFIRRLAHYLFFASVRRVIEEFLRNLSRSFIQRSTMPAFRETH
mgnify:CR=1 FL=1